MVFCLWSGRKSSTERYVITTIGDSLSIFSILLRKGKKFGREKACFYNMKRVVVTVAMEDHMKFCRE